MRTLCVAFSAVILWAGNLCAQTPYYEGKTISMIVGSTAGSTYDSYMRLIADHWGKHIPGNPTFIAQNMPGAGHGISF